MPFAGEAGHTVRKNSKFPQLFPSMKGTLGASPPGPPKMSGVTHIIYCRLVYCTYCAVLCNNIKSYWSLLLSSRKCSSKWVIATFPECGAPVSSATKSTKSIIGANLSEPHINKLSGAGCYGVSRNRTTIHRAYVNFWPPGCRGQNLFAPVKIRRTVWPG